MAGINLPIISKFDDKGIKQATKAFDGIGSSLGKLGGVIATAFSVTAISNFTKDAIAGAEAAEIASRRLGQVADSMGIFGDQTSAVVKRLNEYAEANEFNLAVDADVIKATQAKLLTFKELAQTATDTGGAFDRATAAAVDLAAAGFGSAESNAVQLGKALNDPIKGITALTRSGITFTTAERDKIKALTESGQILEAQNMILGAIETQVGGTAQATASASERINLAFNAVKDGVGFALLPAFEELSLAIVPIAEEVAPSLGEAFKGLTPIFSSVAELLPMLVEAILPIVPAFTKVVEILAELALQIFPVLIRIIEALMPVISSLIPIIGELLIDLIEPLAPALIEILNAFTPLIPVIIELIRAFLPLIQDVLPVLIDLLKNFVVPILVAVAATMTGVLANGIKFLIGVIENLGNFFRSFAEGFSRVWNDTVKSVSDTLNNLGRFFGDTFTNIRNTITKAVGDFGTLLFKAGTDLVQGLINGVLNFGTKIATALKDVVDGAVTGVKQLLGIRSPSRVFDEIGQNIGDGLIKGMDGKVAGVTASAQKLAKAAVPSGFEWVMGPNGPYLERSDFVSGKSDRGVADFGAASASFLLRQQGLSQAEIDRVLTKTIGGTLDQVNATMTNGITLIDKASNRMIQGNLSDADIAERVAQGFKVVEKIAAPIEDLEKAIGDLVSGIQGGQTAYLKPMAAGGFVTTATPALVGEAGPEVVMPLDRFERAIGLGNKEGSSYNISINAGMGSDPVSIGREVVNAIKRYESVSGKVFASA